MSLFSRRTAFSSQDVCLLDSGGPEDTCGGREARCKWPCGGVAVSGRAGRAGLKLLRAPPREGPGARGAVGAARVNERTSERGHCAGDGARGSPASRGEQPRRERRGPFFCIGCDTCCVPVLVGNFVRCASVVSVNRDAAHYSSVTLPPQTRKTFRSVLK